MDANIQKCSSFTPIAFWIHEGDLNAIIRPSGIESLVYRFFRHLVCNGPTTLRSFWREFPNISKMVFSSIWLNNFRLHSWDRGLLKWGICRIGSQLFELFWRRLGKIVALDRPKASWVFWLLRTTLPSKHSYFPAAAAETKCQSSWAGHCPETWGEKAWVS